MSQPAPLPLPHLKNVEKLEKLKLDDKVKVKIEKAAEPEEIQVPIFISLPCSCIILLNSSVKPDDVAS